MTQEYEYDNTIVDANELVTKAAEEAVDTSHFFIDYSKPVERPTPVIYDPRNRNHIIVSEQNIMTIVGEPKSRKTFCATLFLIDFFRQHNDNNDNRIAIHIDTEQGDWHVINTAKRVCDGMGWDYEQTYKSGKFLMANLRKYTWRERLAACEAIIEQHKPYFCVIDGIRDLMESSNDDISSKAVVEKLMKWTEEFKCAICTIIHTNKDGTTPKGHTGADLLEKSELILLCQLLQNGNTKVTWLKGRNERIEDFEFTVNENHVPVRVEETPKPFTHSFTTDKQNKALDSLKEKADAPIAEWLCDIRTSVGCADATARKYFDDFVRLGILIPANKEQTFFTHYKAAGHLLPKPPAQDTQQAISTPQTADIDEPTNDPF